ncbi:MAG TPA: hypothetical protein VFX58_11810 [Chitinophagaceae bacterium]|nr:hypothetical protein [Chitinophagaceae bacterium]
MKLLFLTSLIGMLSSATIINAQQAIQDVELSANPGKFNSGIESSFISDSAIYDGSDFPAVNQENEEQLSNASMAKKKRLNFFIISKRKKGSFDLATRFNVFRAKLKSLFRKKRFVAIVARNGHSASAKIQFRLKKYDARIGTLWFDSHGMYKKGYSLFFIGKDEVSYKTLRDSSLAGTFKALSNFTDPESKIIIGACYGGATYHRSSIDYKDTTRMNGDSMMIIIGQLFEQARIYACESWVMTKPGLFLKREAVAGFPGRKLFRDQCYKPAWENVGNWNEYNHNKKSFNRVNPLTLDMYGNALVRSASYSDQQEVKKDIERNLSKLQAGLYK